MRSRKPLPLMEPESCGFLYLGIQADRPQKAPLYLDTRQRRFAQGQAIDAANDLVKRPDVVSARVFRTHIVPPLPGAPSHDVAMLIRTARISDLDEVRSCETVSALGATELLIGSNAARIGETESDENAVFLFNHFTVAGDTDPVEAWKGLTDWYTSKIGVDNSTALQARDSASEFPLVNYARLPSSPPRFLVSQLTRPSFYRIVRGTLKRHQMRALPGFYRMVH